MDTMETILSRRSIRKYTDKPIEQKIINQLLEAAMSAPSAGNQQPWQFIIVDERNILKEIPKFHPYSQMLKNAQLAILTCGDLSLERHPGFWIQDCSAATQNILLAAQANSLGAVWLGIYPREERLEGIKKLLAIPEHIIPLSMVCLGYPAEHKKPSPRYKESRIHYNGWS